MTRGKYAARAAGQRAATEVEQTESAYRRQIVRLTEERDEARRERDEARAAWRKETRELTGRLSEGLSPRVEALSRELEKFRERCERQKRELRAAEERRRSCARQVVSHFGAEHGMSRTEALEAVAHLYGWDVKIATKSEQRFAAKHGAEALEWLKAAPNHRDHTVFAPDERGDWVSG